MNFALSLPANRYLPPDPDLCHPGCFCGVSPCEQRPDGSPHEPVRSQESTRDNAI